MNDKKFVAVFALVSNAHKLAMHSFFKMLCLISRKETYSPRLLDSRASSGSHYSPNKENDSSGSTTCDETPVKKKRINLSQETPGLKTNADSLRSQNQSPLIASLPKSNSSKKMKVPIMSKGSDNITKEAASSSSCKTKDSKLRTNDKVESHGSTELTGTSSAGIEMTTDENNFIGIEEENGFPLNDDISHFSEMPVDNNSKPTDITSLTVKGVSEFIKTVYEDNY